MAIPLGNPNEIPGWLPPGPALAVVGHLVSELPDERSLPLTHPPSKTGKTKKVEKLIIEIKEAYWHRAWLPAVTDYGQ